MPTNPRVARFTVRRRVRLEIVLDTNMDAHELGGLAEGTLISINEFGKEHIDMPRYEQVHLDALDAGFTVRT